MNKSNENQNETLTRVTLSINYETEVYPLLLNKSQIRLLEYLENSDFFDRGLHIDYDTQEYQTV